MKPRTGRESGVETEQSDRQGEQKQRCNQEYRQSKATGRVKKREVHTDMRTERERERECVHVCVCMRERERETEQEARRRRCTGVTDPEPRSDDETLDGVVSEERVGGARERESEGSP